MKCVSKNVAFWICVTFLLITFCVATILYGIDLVFELQKDMSNESGGPYGFWLASIIEIVLGYVMIAIVIACFYSFLKKLFVSKLQFSPFIDSAMIMITIVIIVISIILHLHVFDTSPALIYLYVVKHICFAVWIPTRIVQACKNMISNHINDT